MRDLDLSHYAAGLRERDRAQRRNETKHCERLRRTLPAVVQRFVREFGVTRVVLFGSFARGDARLDSDVDLLVDGLQPERLFEAMATLSRELDADVDLVPAAAARPEVLQRAFAEGQVLHG